MNLSTGRWVSGNDFFNRESELQILEARVRAGNHTVLSGQRRMGKTSVARELGRRLEDQGWVFLFTDIEGATCAEDVIADIAEAVHPIQSISARFATTMRRLFSENIDEISAADFRIKIRAGLTAGTWRRLGKQLIDDCAAYEKPVLLVIDELPIFLKRVLREDDGAQRVDDFLSWLRGVIQGLTTGSLVLLVSGSIGLEPLVHRLGIPDRINHLDPFRLSPWNRTTSIACLKRLAEGYEVPVEDGVAEAVYDALGSGIPHHVQSFFARLREFHIMEQQDQVSLGDVEQVYRTTLLGPSGQNDLGHYETRLRDALEPEHYTIAMTILAEAATQDRFTPSARRGLEESHAIIVEDAPRHIADILDVLVHDGYLEDCEDGFRIPSRLLKDWWSARFRDHYTPIRERRSIHA